MDFYRTRKPHVWGFWLSICITCYADFSIVRVCFGFMTSPWWCTCSGVWRNDEIVLPHSWSCAQSSCSRSCHYGTQLGTLVMSYMWFIVRNCLYIYVICYVVEIRLLLRRMVLWRAPPLCFEIVFLWTFWMQPLLSGVKFVRVCT